MTKKPCITFYLKAEKEKADGTAPIYARITSDGDRVSFATGKYVIPKRWTDTTQLKKTRKEEELMLKVELEDIRKKLFAIHEQLSAGGKPCEAEHIKNCYLNPEVLTKVTHTMLELFAIHNEKFWEKVVLGKRSEESFKKHRTVQSHLKNFMKDKYNVMDYALNKLEFEFIEEFEAYLRKGGVIDNNTALKYCQFLESMINTAKRKKWMDKNPFEDFEYEFEDVEADFLMEEQLLRIVNKKFATERLNTARDIFLFTCFTGYAPVDARKLTHEHIKRNISGEYWIYTKRSKTGVDSNVPILPPVQAIINKYRNHPDCIVSNKLIPLRSSTNMNEYLKEIGTLCEIPFDLHHYVGRHTFGTLMITKGVSMESVSKMMGHKRIAQTQHYARIVENKVGKEMRVISEHFSTNQLFTAIAEAV